MRARTRIVSAILCAVTFSLLISSALAQGGSHPTPPVNPPPPPARPDPSNFDKDRLLMESETRNSQLKNGEEYTCFLPPLNVVHSRTVAVANLQLSGKAKKEYESACSALKDKKYDAAEAHLRKAVQQEPKYATAWVTLGQMLAARQHNDEARDACSQAVTADASYVHSYLCLADIAARNQQWEEMLKFSRHALDLDPTDDAVAYGYNAGANFSLHKLAEAEKSAMRAIEIDKSHSDPRMHFLLAQIYEAKGDPANEATQLREYLKFASDPKDAEMVRQYLSELEKRSGK
jgi:tetratricopeptide (TPR) repeat protein